MRNGDKPDRAAVRVFPPAVPLVAVLAGIGLDRIWPIALEFPLPTPAHRWIGGLVVVGSILGLGLWSVILMRRSGQSENPWKPTTEIVLRGPYRITRNPMYLQMVLVCIGMAVLLGNLWILMLTPVCAWVLQRFAILPEERYLEARFGDDYRAYKVRVRRWIGTTGQAARLPDPQSPEPAVDEPVIHIHEDDWGMRSIYPLAAMADVIADLEEARAAAERNRVPDGVGWTDIHLIERPHTGFAEEGVPLSKASAALAPIMPRVRRFRATSTGGFELGAHDELGVYQDDAHCYGFDASCFIKLATDGEIVRGVSYEARTSDNNRLAALRAAMEAVDRLVPSMIVDYWEDCAGRIGDRAFLDHYFRALAGDDT